MGSDGEMSTDSELGSEEERESGEETDPPGPEPAGESPESPEAGGPAGEGSESGDGSGEGSESGDGSGEGSEFRDSSGEESESGEETDDEQPLLRPPRKSKLSRFTARWKRKLKRVTAKPFVTPTIIGPTVPIPDQYVDIFKLFFTRELIEKIRDESNKYALEVMGTENYNGWSPITAEELEAFYGLNLLMGLTLRPEKSDCWSRDLAYYHPLIAERISRDRYRDVSRYLC